MYVCCFLDKNFKGPLKGHGSSLVGRRVDSREQCRTAEGELGCGVTTPQSTIDF